MKDAFDKIEDGYVIHNPSTPWIFAIRKTLGGVVSYINKTNTQVREVKYYEHFILVVTQKRLPRKPREPYQTRL